MTEAFLDVPGFSHAPTQGFPGCLKRTDKLGARSPIFEERITVIDRTDWLQVYQDYAPTLRPDVAKIKNQRQEGSCTSNAATQGREIIGNRQLGKAYWVELSPISVYKRVARSANSGSTVNDNVDEMRERGALPTHAEKPKLVKMGLDQNHTMPETGFSTPLPSGWQETAKHFRIDEYFDVASFEGFMTALLLGFAVHYGRAGHSIVADAPVYTNGRWGVEYANSWAMTWGDKGFGIDSESYISGSIRSYGAYAYRTIVVTDELLKLGTD